MGGDGGLEKAISSTGIEYGILGGMPGARKITIEVPEELLQRAQKASGRGITQTVRSGLELLAAGEAYARLRELRGKVKFSRSWEELKEDR